MRTMVPIIAFLGRSGSGKTTLIEFIISKLSSSGVKISVLKSMHDRFNFDTKGKDTWKFTEAGAYEVIGVSPTQTVIIQNKTKNSNHVHKMVQAVVNESPDLIILEGFYDYSRNNGINKIISFNNDSEIREYLKDPLERVIAFYCKDKALMVNEPKLDTPLFCLPYDGTLIINQIKKEITENNLK